MKIWPWSRIEYWRNRAEQAEKKSRLCEWLAKDLPPTEVHNCAFCGIYQAIDTSRYTVATTAEEADDAE